MIQTAPREIKVHTKKFSLKRGRITIGFSWEKEKGVVRQMCLKQRNARMDVRYPFELKKKEKGQQLFYQAVIDLNQYELEIAFWDVMVEVEEAEGETYEAILGGLSNRLKIWLILFPRWTKTKDGHLIYPFVNGARQFTIQYRKYDKKYDSYAFIAKEYLALLCYFILKPYWDNKKIWLICEKFCTMAQDNAMFFFQYCMEQLPEKEKKHILYVIDKKVPEYHAVEKYDTNVIQFMSFKYMIYLCAAEYLISTDAIRHFYIWDSPNSVYKVLYQARKHLIFLQHGVMGFKQCHRTYHKAGGNRVARFVVSSEYERTIIQEYFGYDREEIILTGLARWDVLENRASLEKKEILIMPTWRSWLEYASEELFRKSDYYQNYVSILQDERLQKLLEKHDMVLNFYIHPKFRDYISEFAVKKERIHFIAFGQQPLNELLMSCNLLITDYSSVSWDVYYQEKPVIFYPFDLETYECVQGSYMDLEKDAFGDVVHSKEELFASLEKYVARDFKEEERQKERREYLLPLRDHKNSERIYQEIKSAKLKSKLKQRLER
ncbi:MAG: CDP-glycerol glycerophosphotransferase family protein [Roseburia sp.]|nr:CDP-glycerol glycerophosphotransferase family protein [Roseburia sp.]